MKPTHLGSSAFLRAAVILPLAGTLAVVPVFADPAQDHGIREIRSELDALARDQDELAKAVRDLERSQSGTEREVHSQLRKLARAHDDLAETVEDNTRAVFDVRAEADYFPRSIDFPSSSFGPGVDTLGEVVRELARREQAAREERAEIERTLERIERRLARLSRTLRELSR